MKKHFLFQNLLELWARGATTRSIPWWNIPRCHNCGRVVWGHIPCFAFPDGLRCWDCETEYQRGLNDAMELELALGKPAAAQLSGYGYMTYPERKEDKRWET